MPINYAITITRDRESIKANWTMNTGVSVMKKI